MMYVKQLTAVLSKMQESVGHPIPISLKALGRDRGVVNSALLSPGGIILVNTGEGKMATLPLNELSAAQLLQIFQEVSTKANA